MLLPWWGGNSKGDFVVLKTYIGKSHFVRYERGEDEFFGTLNITGPKAILELHSFSKPTGLVRDEDIVVQLEDLNYATLRNNIHSPGTQSSYNGTRYFSRTNSNEIIVGFRPWRKDDVIETLDFTFSDTNGAFVSPEIQSAIMTPCEKQTPDGVVFSTTVGADVIKVYYTIHMSFETGYFAPGSVRCSVNFEQGKPFSEVGEFIGALRTFFSLAFGIEAAFADHRIKPLKDNELTLRDGRKVAKFFNLIWPGARDEEEKIEGAITPRSFLRSWGAEDREAFSKSLVFWLDRWKDWRGPAVGMMFALREQNTFENYRLINACKWLESTPGAKQKTIHEKSRLKVVIDAATKAAEDQGLVLGSRLKGSINALQTESRRAWVTRLVNKISHLSSRLDKEKMIEDVMTGFTLRGKFAHRKFDHEDNDSFGQYVRQTRAVECLAFLLLVCDLPLPNDHSRVFNPFPFSDYIFHYQK